MRRIWVILFVSLFGISANGAVSVALSDDVPAYSLVERVQMPGGAYIWTAQEFWYLSDGRHINIGPDERFIVVPDLEPDETPYFDLYLSHRGKFFVIHLHGKAPGTPIESHAAWYDDAMSRCVSVTCIRPGTGEEQHPQRLRGNGVVLRTGLVLTALHVIYGTSVWVDGRKARVEREFPEHDLALLSAKTPEIPAVKIRDPVHGELAYCITDSGDGKKALFGRVLSSRYVKAYLPGFGLGCSGSGLYGLDGSLIALNRGLDDRENAVSKKGSVIRVLLASFLEENLGP